MTNLPDKSPRSEIILFRPKGFTAIFLKIVDRR